MDPLLFLRRHHLDIIAQFGRIAGTAHALERQRLIEGLARDLELHLRLEEEALYPAVWELATRRAKEAVVDAYNGHAAIKLVLEELPGLNAPAERFSRRMSVFQDLVGRHVEDTETAVFEFAKALGRKTLDGLGDEMGAKLEAALDRRDQRRRASAVA